MQFYIWEIKHISYTNEDTALSCPRRTGQLTQNYFTWPTVLREPTAWNKYNLISTNSISHFLYQTHLIHTWRDIITIPLEDTESSHQANCIEGANYMKQIQFNWNWCNFIFVHRIKYILYMHEETAFPCPGWTQNYYPCPTPRELYRGSQLHE